jgi:hypothetical protein
MKLLRSTLNGKEPINFPAARNDVIISAGNSDGRRWKN